MIWGACYGLIESNSSPSQKGEAKYSPFPGACSSELVEGEGQKEEKGSCSGGKAKQERGKNEGEQVPVSEAVSY